MKTTDFNAKVTSSKLKENINKMFGMNVPLEKYSREQLENMRNLVRTRMFQQEGTAGINDLLTNETYQKDKAVLALINTRIKEMLGEDIKKLRDKMTELSEAKKGVRAPKHKIHAQGTAAKDYDGDGKKESPKDEVWGSRAKAAAKAGKPFSEAAKPDFLDMDKDGNKKEPMKKAVKDKKKKIKEGAEDHAELVMAAKEMVDRVTGWMEDTAEMQTESMLELADAIRDEMGQAASDAFIGMVKPGLDSLYTALDSTRTSLNGGVSQLTGEGEPADMMGTDDMGDMGDLEPPVDADADMMDAPVDDEGDFGAAEPATGGDEPADRAKRESIQRIVKKVTKENVNGRKLVTSLSKKK